MLKNSNSERELYLFIYLFFRNSIRTLFYFLMRTIFKLFTEFVIMLFSLFLSCSLQALSSPTMDCTRVMAMKAQDPNHQATRELLSFHFLNLSPHLSLCTWHLYRVELCACCENYSLNSQFFCSLRGCKSGFKSQLQRRGKLYPYTHRQACIYIDNIHTYTSACMCTDSLSKDTQETHFSNLPPGEGPG